MPRSPVRTQPPLPPPELRELAGSTDPADYDNPSGEPIWPGLPESAWRAYLDFGCGCGRSARRLILQRPRPQRYLGLDLHAGMIRWCNEHLAPHAPGFTFQHHDVYNPGLNPNPLRPWALPFPVEDRSFSLIEATSVFTHLVEGQAEFYLDEIARVLADDGVVLATFFLFHKSPFPMMHEGQNALYINDRDPTDAVIFDHGWLRDALHRRGLLIAAELPPSAGGSHWELRIARGGSAAHAAPRRRRAELPPIDPVAVELTEAKRYIASLEEDLERARREQRPQAPPPRPIGPLQRLRDRVSSTAGRGRRRGGGPGGS